MSAIVSGIGGILGLNPSAPGVGRPKAPKSLGRLSLAQLTRIRGRKAKKKRRGERVLGELQQQAEPTGTGFPAGGRGLLQRRIGQQAEPTPTGLAGVGQRALQGRIRQQERDIKKTGRRLSRVGEARQSLIRRGVAARTGRATAISTLLTRGI